jgi:hypothetical protein
MKRGAAPRAKWMVVEMHSPDERSHEAAINSCSAETAAVLKSPTRRATVILSNPRIFLKVHHEGGEAYVCPRHLCFSGSEV